MIEELVKYIQINQESLAFSSYIGLKKKLQTFSPLYHKYIFFFIYEDFEKVFGQITKKKKKGNNHKPWSIYTFPYIHSKV